jgi:hypothetical protein
MSELTAGQEFFEAIVRTCDFTPLQDDMHELINALMKDNPQDNVDVEYGQAKEVLANPNCYHENDVLVANAYVRCYEKNKFYLNALQNKGLKEENEILRRALADTTASKIINNTMMEEAASQVVAYWRNHFDGQLTEGFVYALLKLEKHLK